MTRVLFFAALVAASLTVVLLPASVAADIGPLQTPIVLSCSDGHSVPLSLDATALTALLADVQAINASGSGTSCGVATSTSAPASSGANWTVFDYNPSGQAIAPRNSPGSMPAQTAGATTTFPFLDGHYTALLTTNDKSLTGDLSTTTLTDQIDLSGPAVTFETQHGGGNCVGNQPAAVRFFFTAPAASGKGTTDPGFYTATWWSNPVNLQLLSGTQSGQIVAQMWDPNEWTDWNGQRGTTMPVQFETAIHNVQSVGLSFGGECFFETGVKADYAGAPPPYEQFSSTFSES